MKFMNTISRSSRKMQFDISSTSTSVITSIFTSMITSILILIPDASIAKETPILDISLPSTSSTAPELSSEFNQDHLKNNPSTLRLAFLDTPTNNVFSRFHDRYLTIHYGKTEKIKADYQNGAYCVSYEKTW